MICVKKKKKKKKQRHTSYQLGTLNSHKKRGKKKSAELDRVEELFIHCYIDKLNLKPYKKAFPMKEVNNREF